LVVVVMAALREAPITELLVQILYFLQSLQMVADLVLVWDRQQMEGQAALAAVVAGAALVAMATHHPQPHHKGTMVEEVLLPAAVAAVVVLQQ
jgi:hypothetical protein